MAKQLAILLVALSCITVALSLSCKFGGGAAGSADPWNCTDATVKNCYVRVTTTPSLGGLPETKSYDYNCATAKDNDKKLDECETETSLIKKAYCNTDNCNTKEYAEKICKGGQSGLKSSFIFAFGSIIICLLNKSVSISS